MSIFRKHSETSSARYPVVAVVAILSSQLTVVLLTIAASFMRQGWLRPLTIALAVMACGLALLGALWHRKMVRALHELTNVTSVAVRRLPELMRKALDGHLNESVTVRPTISVASVLPLADDFDLVYQEAVRMATEQGRIRSGYSEVFVNVFRRSQSLMQRQLQIIEQLEEGDRSPAELNRLFQLDHLVTRMRRNNENVLVLSGTELVRRTRSPVLVSDLLRAAMSEIDHYQRVVVLETPTIKVANSAAGDLIRIIAELLDNAASFSSPDQRVTVQAELSRRQGLSIGVFDNGIGMSDQDIVKANQKLTRLGSAEIARSSRVGLLVVGRLAGRHGIGVELFGGDNVTGVSALVSVPSDVLIEEDTVRRKQLPGAPVQEISANATDAANRRLIAAPSRLAWDGLVASTTVRRQGVDEKSPEMAKRGRVSSWHSRSVDPVRRRRQPPVEHSLDVIERAHADVPDELPVRIPNRSVGVRSPRDRKAVSRWFRARDSVARQREVLANPAARRDRSGAEAGWASTADQGWQIVETVASSAEYTYTEDGLPLRQRGARLVPGSAGQEPTASRSATKPVERDPGYTRSRLSSYQQGVQKAKQQEKRRGGAKHSAGWTILERKEE